MARGKKEKKNEPQVLNPKDFDKFRREFEYHPLSLVNMNPENHAETEFEMRSHIGDADADWDEMDVDANDAPIRPDTLIGYGIKEENSPKLCICITQYNEPPRQLVESLAGIYRAYYELINIDPLYLNRVHIVVVSDGYEPLRAGGYLNAYDKANIHDMNKLIPEYIDERYNSETHSNDIKDKKLHFINEKNMTRTRIEKKDMSPEEQAELEAEVAAGGESKARDKNKHTKYLRAYGANNIGHCFSRVMDFVEWMACLTKEEAEGMTIDNYSVYDFLLGEDRTGKVKTQKFVHYPLPIHFVVKHYNQGKIESHKWFFKGFCHAMQPKFAQIIDCGSIPLWNSISYIIMHMETFSNVGGACGEIECLLNEKKEDGTAVDFVESVLLRAQYVEYKVSHYMDKATESLFGFVSVLPGAFSTFRWECINGDPLESFLKGCKDEFADVEEIMPCFTANKYLAEDRIMCLEIIAKKDCNFIINYIPGAKCLTDPPLSLSGLVKQRRRWFNGSMFATFHVMGSMYRIWGRNCVSFIRNLFYMLLYLYMIVLLALSFIIVGLFYSAFSIFVRATLPSSNCLSITSAANVLENVYLVFLFICLMLSTTVDVNWAETGFRICSLFMGAFTILMVVSSVFYALGETLNSLAVLFILAFLASYFVPLLLNLHHLKAADFLKGAIYSVYLSPTYVNIFTIFAISNIHDVSWGSRPATNNAKVQVAAAKKDEMYRNYRANFLVFWISINIAVGGVVTYISRNGQTFVILAIGGFLVSVILIKLFCSCVHIVVTWYHRIMVSIKKNLIRGKRENNLHADAKRQREDFQFGRFEPFKIMSKAEQEERQRLDEEAQDKEERYMTIMKKRFSNAQNARDQMRFSHLMSQVKNTTKGNFDAMMKRVSTKIGGNSQIGQYGAINEDTDSDQSSGEEDISEDSNLNVNSGVNVHGVTLGKRKGGKKEAFESSEGESSSEEESQDDDDNSESVEETKTETEDDPNSGAGASPSDVLLTVANHRGGKKPKGIIKVKSNNKKALESDTEQDQSALSDEDE